MELALSISWLAIVSWLIMRAYAQRDLFPVARPEQIVPYELAARIHVLVPARNESANLARCVGALLNQAYPPGWLRVTVIDDHSTDDTFEIAASIARREPRLAAIKSSALPPHWVGKCHACWTGVGTVSPEDDWLCFVDADVVAERELLSAALAVAQAEQLDLLSLTPRQRLGSFAERLIIPCGLYLMAFCQDLSAVQASHSDKVTASGQFMLIRRAAYDAVGGHAAVHDAICEDVRLALRIKRAGGRVMLQDGKALLSARMYTGWSSLWNGISKNLVDMLGGPVTTLITAALVLLLSVAAVAVPALDGASCAQGDASGCIALIPACLGTAAALGLHVAGALYFGNPFWYGLLFPLGYAIGACLALESLRRRWSGTIVWKGRTYP